MISVTNRRQRKRCLGLPRLLLWSLACSSARGPWFWGNPASSKASGSDVAWRQRLRGADSVRAGHQTRREAISPPDLPPFKGPRSAPQGRLPVSLAQILALKIKKHRAACGVMPPRLGAFVTWQKQKGDALLWSGVQVETPPIQGPREGSRFQTWYLKVRPNFPLRKIFPPSLLSFLLPLLFPSQTLTDHLLNKHKARLWGNESLV